MALGTRGLVSLELSVIAIAGAVGLPASAAVLVSVAVLASLS